MLAGSAEAPGHREAIHVRQHDVQDCQIRRVEIGRGEGFATIGGRDDLEACKTQRRGQQLADVGLVVDNKKLGFGTVLFHDIHDAPRIWEFTGCCM